MLKSYHTDENLNIDISTDLSVDLSIKCYRTPIGGFDVVIGEEVYPINVKERNRWRAVLFIMMIGPAGIAMNYGFIAGFFSLLTYALIGIKFGFIYIGCFHILSMLSPFVYFSKYKIIDPEIKKKAKDYLNTEWKKKKDQRSKDEGDYYSKKGGSKLKTVLFGNPEARSSLINAGKSFSKAMSGDKAEFAKAKEHLKESLDPIKKDKDKAS
ncbi:MAG: hypothetical protein CME71_00300 [Halobacteriovorax sp.]|nr:hypothetical protein [Halobacteriovorax sp.]